MPQHFACGAFNGVSGSGDGKEGTRSALLYSIGPLVSLRVRVLQNK